MKFKWMLYLFSFSALFLLIQPNPVYAAPKSIHVLVALCDNRYQGIVPVSDSLGDGQKPETNLYWGAAYGIKTYFRKQPDWIFLKSEKSPSKNILERIILRHKNHDAYLIADAYDGQYIYQTTEDLFQFAAGHNPLALEINRVKINFGGNANHLIYVGHNGLMDFSLPTLAPNNRQDLARKDVSVFACKSQQYFYHPLKKTGAQPGILTTQFMAPEAYSVHTLINGWLENRSYQQIHQNVAATYSRFQKLKNPAYKLFFYEQ